MRYALLAAALIAASPAAALNEGSNSKSNACAIEMARAPVFDRLIKSRSGISGIVVKETVWSRMTFAEKRRFADVVNCAIAGPGFYAIGTEFRGDLTNKVLGRREIEGLAIP